MRSNLAFAVPAVLLTVIASAGPCQAAPATIDLQVTGPTRVIQGASANIFSYVANSAPSGSDNLNFSISYQYPYGTSTLPGQTRVAGAGYGVPYVGYLDTTQTGLGAQVTTVTVSDPAASNSPVSASFGVQVVTHAQPWFYVTVPGQPDILALEPTFTPEQFAATGGGETFAARSSVINDPAVPTAMLDLDSIFESGDSQIRAQFLSSSGTSQTLSEFVASFKNLVEIHEASGQSVITSPLLYEQYGRIFDIYVDTSTPGTFTKTWTFGFSDEDILGASSPGSVARTFTYTATVTPVPVPAAVWLFGSGLAGFIGVAYRRRRRDV